MFIQNILDRARYLLVLTLPLGCINQKKNSAVKETIIFGLKETTGSDKFWNDNSELNIDLIAPFSTMFQEKNEEKKYDGTVFLGKNIGAAEFEIRGATSLNFCRFPKMSFKLKKNSKIGVFGDIGEFQVGTHCDPDTAKKDPALRLFGSEAMKREQLVYKLAQILGVSTSRSRIVKLVYKDSVALKEIAASEALLVESHKDVAEKLNATQLKSEERDSLKRTDLDKINAAETHLFNLFSANPDFVFNDISGTMNANDPIRTFRNIKIVRKNDSGVLLSYPYEFEVSLFVRGFIFTKEVVDEIASASFFPEKSVSQRINRFGLEYFKKKHDSNIVHSTLEKFVSHKAAVNEGLKTSSIEESHLIKISEFIGDFFTVAVEILAEKT